jgi:tetratricopeptide (TPR) repeat protein
MTMAARVDPGPLCAVDSLLTAGHSAFQRGDHTAAVEHFHAALMIDQTCAEAWKALGDAVRRLGQNDMARDAYARAIALRPGDPAIWFALAILLTQMRLLDPAIHAFRNGLRHDPSQFEAHTNLALLHFLKGDNDAALADLVGALRLAPENLRALVLAARVQQRRARLPEAEALCRRVLALDPDHGAARLVLGRVLFESGRLPEARAVLDSLAASAPDDAEVWHELGVVLMALGHLDAAREAFETALRANPGLHATYPPLAGLVNFAQRPDLAERVAAEAKALAADPQRLTGPNDPLIPIHFAAGKALDDCGDHARALDHYIAGGGLVRAHLSFDEAGQIAVCKAIKAMFTREFLVGHGLVGDTTAAPVFIVGMARSGSTLVEHILSCHPAVHGGDEARHLPCAIDACAARFPDLPRWPAMMGALGQDQVAMIAHAYLDAALAPAGNVVRVTDKLLSNYFFVGLIAVLFPNARIINTLRNPVDTCVSAFATLFADDMGHTYDFGELGRYYCRYVDLMDHWRSVLPAGMMTMVRYEDLVHDVEGEARRLIAFVGLDWDPACLAFHASTRAVHTASVAQVRRPLYTSSIARWRRYGPALDPLIAALAPSAGKIGGLESDAKKISAAALPDQTPC